MQEREKRVGLLRRQQQSHLHLLCSSLLLISCTCSFVHRTSDDGWIPCL